MPQRTMLIRMPVLSPEVMMTFGPGLPWRAMTEPMVLLQLGSALISMAILLPKAKWMPLIWAAA